MPQPISHDTAQQEYLTLFFSGHQHPLQQPQPQESAAPFIIPIDPQLLVQKPGPPVPVAPL